MKINESQRTDFTAGRSSREPSTCIDNRYIETYEPGISCFYKGIRGDPRKSIQNNENQRTSMKFVRNRREPMKIKEKQRKSRK